jgi:ribokinase
MPPYIIVVGSSNTDMIVRVPRIPQPGETLLGGAFSTAAGGKGANQAVAAARAGGEVTLIACVGTDLFGQQALAGFRQDHIHIDQIRVMEETPSGVAMIFVAEDGENAIAVASGCNALLSPEDIRNAGSAFRQADTVLMQLETPLQTIEAAAALARQHDLRTILNPAPAQSLADKLLHNITLLTPNETEAEQLTGIRVDSERSARQAAEQLLDRGVQSVLITLGARGSFVATREGFRQIPAFNVKAVDTTAAGDVYNGALAVALSEGEDLDTAVRFAHASAALSVTKHGAQPSAPHKKDIEEFLKRHEEQGGNIRNGTG